MNIYYVETTRWNDGKYQAQVEQIFHGEKPQFVEEIGIYTSYSLQTEPTTFDQQWIVGSSREGMVKAGLIEGQPQKPIHGLKVRPAALKDPSIINKGPIEWDDLTDDTKDLLNR